MAAKKIYMLQRVQTLYILSATILIITLLFKHFMYVLDPGGEALRRYQDSLLPVPYDCAARGHVH